MAVAIARRAWLEEFRTAERAERPFVEEGSYAVVDVAGPLVQHGNGWWQSYDELCERTAAAVKASAPAVCLRINSPGGDFAGCLEVSRELRAMVHKAGKRLVAFTDSAALSAAFGIATAADELVFTPSAFLGSIGVWAPLCDATVANAMHGMNVVIVASGARKVDHNPNVPISKDAIAALQAQVDSMAELFFALVGEHRGLGRAEVSALEGAELYGMRALAAGLGDRLVGTWTEFLASGSAGEVGTKGKAMSVNAKGKSFDEALAEMRKCAEGEDEDAKRAQRLLKAIEEEDKKNGNEPSSSEGDKPKDGEPKDDKDKMAAAARALAAAGLPTALGDLLGAIHSKVQALDMRDLEQQKRAAAQAEADERAKLLGQRPDFAAAIVESLKAAPLEIVRKAVTTWPRPDGTALPAVAGATMPATVGATQGLGVGGAVLPPTMEHTIDKAMGFQSTPTKFAVGCGDRAAARAYLAEREKQRAAERAAQMGGAQ